MGERRPRPTDELIAAIRDGARTNQIADRLGILINRPWVLSRLRYLEAAGRVRRSERHTFINSIYWEAA
jgi:DNA-binding HxlR family transcriptional regulator